jgi:hypothetical protein
MAARAVSDLLAVGLHRLQYWLDCLRVPVASIFSASDHVQKVERVHLMYVLQSATISATLAE